MGSLRRIYRYRLIVLPCAHCTADAMNSRESTATPGHLWTPTSSESYYLCIWSNLPIAAAHVVRAPSDSDASTSRFDVGVDLMVVLPIYLSGSCLSCSVFRAITRTRLPSFFQSFPSELERVG